MLEYWSLPNGNCKVKFKKKYDGLKEDNDVKNSLPAQQGAFILSNSKRKKNNLSEKKTLFLIMLYIIVTRTACRKKKNWDVLEKSKLVGRQIRQDKKDYEKRGIFYGLI